MNAEIGNEQQRHGSSRVQLVGQGEGMLAMCCTDHFMPTIAALADRCPVTTPQSPFAVLGLSQEKRSLGCP